MIHKRSKPVLCVMVTLFTILSAGCETMQKANYEMDPVENYGGGGGDASS